MWKNDEYSPAWRGYNNSKESWKGNWDNYNWYDKEWNHGKYQQPWYNNNSWSHDYYEKKGSQQPQSQDAHADVDKIYIDEILERMRRDIKGFDYENATRSQLMEKVKKCQRDNVDIRTSWVHYTTTEAKGLRDPTRHEVDFLKEFFRGIHNGDIEKYRRMKNPHRGAGANEIFVGGIGIIRKEQVQAYFEQFGALRYVDIKRDKGFGFVKFDSTEVMEKVLKSKEHLIEGKRVEVKQAENRNPKDRKDPETGKSLAETEFVKSRPTESSTSGSATRYSPYMTAMHPEFETPPDMYPNPYVGAPNYGYEQGRRSMNGQFAIIPLSTLHALQSGYTVPSQLGHYEAYAEAATTHIDSGNENTRFSSGFGDSYHHEFIPGATEFPIHETVDAARISEESDHTPHPRASAPPGFPVELDANPRDERAISTYM